MTADEQAIRDLLAEWLRASRADDLPTVLSLMAEDVVFLIPGRPPMRGRDAFAATSQGMKDFQIEGQSEIQEIHISGDWAYCWTQLTVTITPLKGGAPAVRSGPTLSVLRKQSSGAWVLFRDANMLTKVS